MECTLWRATLASHHANHQGLHRVKAACVARTAPYSFPYTMNRGGEGGKSEYFAMLRTAWGCGHRVRSHRARHPCGTV